MKMPLPVVGVLAGMPLYANAANESDGGFGTGLLIFLGFVAACFVVVAMMRERSSSARRGTDAVSVDEFVRATTATDRPSIER